LGRRRFFGLKIECICSPGPGGITNKKIQKHTFFYRSIPPGVLLINLAKYIPWERNGGFGRNGIGGTAAGKKDAHLKKA
jgi:hypothetical protein